MMVVLSSRAYETPVKTDIRQAEFARLAAHEHVQVVECEKVQDGWSYTVISAGIRLALVTQKGQRRIWKIPERMLKHIEGICCWRGH